MSREAEVEDWGMTAMRDHRILRSPRHSGSERRSLLSNRPLLDTDGAARSCHPDHTLGEKYGLRKNLITRKSSSLLRRFVFGPRKSREPLVLNIGNGGRRLVSPRNFRFDGHPLVAG